MSKRKFKVGDRVVVKRSLVIGGFYVNFFGDREGDFFREKMCQYMNIECTVMEVCDNGYRLDVDNKTWNYTDEMLVSRPDVVSKTSTVSIQHYDTVTLVEVRSQLDTLMKQIDESLLSNDKEKFLALSEIYNDLYEKFETLVKVVSVVNKDEKFI